MAETHKDTRHRTAPDANRPQCHVISNTHWDREWKHSAARTRHKLIYMMDMLLDILEREPQFASFHLDSQTLPLLDYLDVRPEREEQIRTLAGQGRLVLGPWFCLPDEFCVAGECLVRNLLLGHRTARRFGPVAKTGYSPFSWGQISQMPQLYRGFGIDVMMFYRGVNTRVAPRAEFIWQAPDGTEILASRLGFRPRYNAWYVLQRPAYWGACLDALNDFLHRWDDGHAPFRLINEPYAPHEYQFAHPRFDYDAGVIPAAAAQALREQDADWSTPHRLWSIGHDGSCPDVREIRMVQDAAEALRPEADVFFSTFAAFQDGLRAGRRPDWPVVTGEMRHPYTQGSTSGLLGWILSARVYLKQDNFRTERMLIGLAEPLAAFAAWLGADYPRAELDRAWQWLLQNHPHDSIGGCGRDVVHDDMLYRSRQSREISTCVIEDALREIAGAVDLSGWQPDDVAVVVCNPLPAARSEVLPVVLDTPGEWPGTGFEILDDENRPVTCQVVSTQDPFEERIHTPHDTFTFMRLRRHFVRVQAPEVPGCGYRTLRVRPATSAKPRQPQTMLADSRTMGNEHLVVTVNANGTFDLLHKVTGRYYGGLGFFRDSGEAGNPWTHEAPAQDEVFTTLSTPAEVTVLRDGALEASLRVRLPWSLPAGLTDDARSRSPQRVPYEIVNTLTLRRGQPWLEVVTELVNTARDHYLRVSFPTGIRTDTAMAQTPFDVVARPIPVPDYSLYDEPPQPEQPLDTFVDVSDGEAGLALLVDGLKAYEAHDDSARTLSLTLLRCFALRTWVPEKADLESESRGAQCPGRHEFRYAVYPHAGDWAVGGVWAAAERFHTPLLAGQIAPHRHGTQPLRRSFLELAPAGLVLSAIKQSESGDGWIIRVFNPLSKPVTASLRLNGGLTAPTARLSPVQRAEAERALPAGHGRRWSQVRVVTLEETPLETLPLDPDGHVRFTVPAKRVVTVEWVP